MMLLAACSLATWLAVAGVCLHGAARMRRLEDVSQPRADDAPDDDAPRVSVIVTAHNEEPSAERTLRALLAQEYPDLEIVYVDDRSEDRTGEIADRLSREDARIHVIHLQELPAGWFGKNHAAWRAAEAATGDVLLFTDGDAVFTSDAVARGVRHLVRDERDFLSVFGLVPLRGELLRASVMTLILALFARTTPWRVRDASSPASFGFGPYLMFRRAAYHAIGGHRQIALRPDEDVRICQLAKRSGLRSDVVLGQSHVQCEWYASLGGLAAGLEKSFFATLDYSLALAAGVTIYLLWLMAPFVAAPLLLVTGAPSAVVTSFAAAACVGWGLAVLTARALRYPLRTGLLYPLATLIVLQIMWRSVVVTSRRGVTWGGPPVPLSTLRSAHSPGTDRP